MELSLISKYRTQLMGIAIIWIMLFHSHIHPTNIILSTIKSMGYGGVDIFMFLSGFGIYYSLFIKKETLKVFYKKRALRVLPYYIPIVLLISIFYYVHDVWDIKQCFYNVTTLGFWFGLGHFKIFDWYVPSLLMLYLFSPLLAKLFRINKNVVTVSLIVFYYLLSFLLLETKLSYLVIFTTRIPLYIAGFWFADYITNHKDAKLSPVGVLIVIISLIIGFSLLVYTLYTPDLWMQNDMTRFPFAIITFPFCMIYAYLFSLAKNYKYPILTFFGTYTLVLFIFHERVMWIFKYYKITHNDYLIFAITIILAVSWQNLVNLIVKKIN